MARSSTWKPAEKGTEPYIQVRVGTEEKPVVMSGHKKKMAFTKDGVMLLVV